VKVGDQFETTPFAGPGCPPGRQCIPPNGYRAPMITSISTSIDASGTLYTSWADTRNLAANCLYTAATPAPPCDTDVFYAYSTDQKGYFCSGQSHPWRGYNLPQSVSTHDQIGLGSVGWMADLVRFKLARPADLLCPTNIGRQTQSFTKYFETGDSAPPNPQLTQAQYEVWLCSSAVMTHHCSVAVRQRWASWDVEQLAMHNTYVVLSNHWSPWRVRTFILAELVTWFAEGIRHFLLPRTDVEMLDEPYGRRLARRIRLDLRFFLGLEKPKRRFQPPTRQASAGVRPAG
jgi:hypothetical protein